MTGIGTVHFVIAWLALGTGLLNLLRPKGTRSHRALGYLFVFSMATINATALSMYRLTGHFNLFHGFALVSLAATAAAILPALRRRGNWLVRHARGMHGAYVGLFAAAANEMLTRVVSRVVPLNPGQFWSLSIAITACVLAAGFALARRQGALPGGMPGAAK